MQLRNLRPVEPIRPLIKCFKDTEQSRNEKGSSFGRPKPRPKRTKLSLKYQFFPVQCLLSHRFRKSQPKKEKAKPENLQHIHHLNSSHLSLRYFESGSKSASHLLRNIPERILLQKQGSGRV